MTIQSNNNKQLQYVVLMDYNSVAIKNTQRIPIQNYNQIELNN